MDNTMYKIEMIMRKGIGFDISFDNTFVGNAWFISIPLIVFIIRFPRKSRHEEAAYPWELFNFVWFRKGY